MERSEPSWGIVVVGAGLLGTQRAAAAVAAEGARLVAVCDCDAAAAERLAQRFGVQAETSFDRALERSDVDAVLIATPHACHAAQVKRVLEAGKHVLCEKPLAISANQARVLCHLAHDRGLRLATGFNHRFYPPVRDTLRLVREGAIGRVTSVRAQIGHRASPGFLQTWHADPRQSGGGTLMDNGPHACDLVRLLMGEVVAATGAVRSDPTLPRGVELEAFALYRGYDHAIAEVRSSWELEAGYLTLDVRGTAGHLHAETAPWHLRGTLADGRRIRLGYLFERLDERAFRMRFGCERSLAFELETFVSTQNGWPRPHGTGWDGCRATEMIQAVYESDQTGQEVPLAPLPVRTPGALRRAAHRERA